MAMKGIMPRWEYYNNPNLKNNEGKTVCYYLWENGILVPEYW